MVSDYLKYGAALLLLASLYYLVLTGKMAVGDYQTLAVSALSALGGYHAGRFLPGKGDEK